MQMNRSKNTAYIYYIRLSEQNYVSDGDASAVGEWLLKRALRDIFGLNLEEEERGKGPHGKPYLVNHPEIHYNISHSADFIVCAVSGSPIGIDIQEKRVVDVIKVGRRIFPNEEYREFLKSEDKQDEFFRQWVLNESYLKWTGDGLTKDLRVLKREGWHQFLHFHRNYLCAIWSGKPMNIEIREV